MLCDICKEDKLSNEFPPENLTDECDHPSLICMRCIIRHVKDKQHCPFEGCGVPVDRESKSVKLFEAFLAEMFMEYETTYTPQVEPTTGSVFLQITVLNGESKRIPYNSAMTVLQLKEKIKQEWGYEVAKQKLLYGNCELETYNDGSPSKISYYNVKPYSTVFLVILLYSIPESFDHVVFDLYWGYPSTGKDYLDASCLVFQGTSLIGLIDYSRRFSSQGIKHSGDVMDSFRRLGHHTINVHIKQLPAKATHLYFTLSAWNSPNISRYPNPSLKFYEATNPGKNLCKTTFSHAGFSQAVVMCSVSRSKNGTWQIFESGKTSAGNARNYQPLEATIKGLIQSGF